MTDRLTVNAGLRYDIVTGFDLDQSQSRTSSADAARRPRAASTACPASRSSARHDRRGHEQLAAAHRRGLRPRAATARTSSAPAGASTTTSATPTPTSCSRASAPRAARARSSPRRTPPASGTPTARFFAVGQPISQHRVARTRSTRTVRSTAATSPPPGIEQPWTSQTSAGWSHQLSLVDGVRRRLRARRGHATSASGGRSTRASTAARAAMPTCR